MEVGNLSSREIEPDRAVAELFSHYGGGQQSGESGAEAIVEQAQLSIFQHLVEVTIPLAHTFINCLWYAKSWSRGALILRTFLQCLSGGFPYRLRVSVGVYNRMIS
jgi:hypothetical protein